MPKPKSGSGRASASQADAEEHKGLVATTERAITDMQSAAAAAAAKAEAAQDRIGRLRRGEDVPGGLGKPFTREDVERELIKLGVSKSEQRHWMRAHALHEIAQAIGGETAWKEVQREILEATERGRKAAVRRILAEWLVSVEQAPKSSE